MKRAAQILAAVALIITATNCSRTDACAVCQRECCAGMGAKVELRSGKSLHCCCPRCALAYLKTAAGQITSLTVQDWASGKQITAKDAIFVEGSDLNHCAMMKPQRLPQGGVAMACYDRCQPGLLAFADRKVAENFTAQHGGKILDYAAVAAK